MKIKLLVLATLYLVIFSFSSRALGQIYQVDVGNRNLVARCSGEGQPTVVLESGLGDDAFVWTNMNVQSGIAAFVRVCAYSRAGLGSSEAAPGERHLQDVVNDLAALLADGFIEGPVVVVGHSIGGLIANIYAHQHPQKVVGLVFIDSSHPNSDNEMNEVAPPALVAASSAYDKQNPSPENWDVDAALTQGETSFMEPGSLGDKPVVVLTADTTAVDEDLIAWIKENIWSGYNEANLRAENRVWAGLQEELAALSRNTRHTTVKESTHYIQFDNPEAVVAAVQQVVEAVRTGESLGQ